MSHGHFLRALKEFGVVGTFKKLYMMRTIKFGAYRFPHGRFAVKDERKRRPLAITRTYLPWPRSLFLSCLPQPQAMSLAQIGTLRRFCDGLFVAPLASDGCNTFPPHRPDALTPPPPPCSLGNTYYQNTKDYPYGAFGRTH